MTPSPTPLERKIKNVLEQVQAYGEDKETDIDSVKALPLILSLFQDEVKELIAALDYIKFCQQTSHLQDYCKKCGDMAEEALSKWKTNSSLKTKEGK